MIVSVALAVGLGAVLVRPRLERGIEERLQQAAARRGLVARAERVRVGLWPLVRVTNLRLEKAGVWAASTDTAALTLRVGGRGLIGRTRLALGQLTVVGPSRLGVVLEPSTWDLLAPAVGGAGVALRAPSEGLTLTWLPAGAGDQLEVSANELPAGVLSTLTLGGETLLDAGVVSGTFRCARAPQAMTFGMDVSARDVRLPALSGDGRTPPGLGAPTSVALRFEGDWDATTGSLRLPRWGLRVEGASVSGRLSVLDARTDPRVDLALEVERVDFVRLFRTSGLAQPAAAALAVSSATREGDLGSASLSTRVVGRWTEPSSFSVTQRLDFTPPPRMPPALEALRGDFVHEVTLPGGERKKIEVAGASPDFVALGDVPPLFLRTLLLGEDAGFYGHRGIDLAELPAAIITDWARGRAARGASTITQQLAKNLFLSREKQLGRKLQELSLALLLEAALGKERILEIYVNVIEWGPGLYGLRPAARRYFHAEPKDLTPRQMAFLVTLIPGPVKYQRGFAGGGEQPWLRQLVDDLLLKLCVLGALSDEDYQAALAEDLHVDTPDPEP